MSITALATLLLSFVYAPPSVRPRISSAFFVLAGCLIIAPIFTSIDNSYELTTASGSIPGFYPLTALKFCGRNVLMMIPMYIGYRFLSTERARRTLLSAIPVATLFYSIPMLFEIRMSPQLHRWVYGYFPHSSFAQQIRGGGFRPVVFFPHGLALALFTSIAVIAAVVLVRNRARVLGFSAKLSTLYLSGLLMLCKSLGPVIYVVLFAPVVLLMRPRTWVKIGCAASLFVCAYPLLRSHDLTPIDLVKTVAGSVSSDRSASFQTRLTNEKQLLAKANEKPVFGWGAWGRNRVFDEWSGKDISVTDGEWIIQFGTFGWFGYLSLFGLLAVAEFSALRATSRDLSAANITRGGLAVLLAVYLINSIPNATDLSLIFLIGGSAAASSREPRTSAVLRSAGANTFTYKEHSVSSAKL